MAKTLFGTYTLSGYTLAAASQGTLNPVTASGSIDIGSGTIPAALYGQAGGAAWTVTNQGEITGGAVAALGLAGGGTVVNASSGVLSGHFGVLIQTGPGDVTNLGGITAANAGTTAAASQAVGVLLRAGGGVTNQSPGQIAGQGWGVAIYGGAGAVANSGSINGAAQAGVYENNGTVTNQSSGVITGGWGVLVKTTGSVSNAGGIAGTSQGGVFLGGGVVANQGTISGVWGVAIEGGAGTVNNTGLLLGTAQSGVYLSGGANGTVTNATGGRISGPSGVVVANQSGTVANSGSIGATSTSGVAVSLASGFTNRLIVDPGAAFSGPVDGGNAVGSPFVSTLELGAAPQPGTLAGIGTQFLNFGRLTIDPGAAWSLSGSNSLAAAATLLAQGSLTLNGAVLLDGATTISGTSAAILVTGAGGTWNESAPLAIGGANGAFTVNGSAAATVVATASLAAVTLGAVAGDVGSLQVGGAGSSFRAVGELTVGVAGDGHVLVDNQASLTTGGAAIAPSQGVVLGVAAGSAGDALVSGAQSKFSNTGEFIVGDSGLGSLEIAFGGTVATTPGTVAGLAGLAIAATSGAAGSSVDVSGAGSLLNVTGLLDVGVNGSGAMQISSGATATAGSLDAGNVASAVGQVSVSGAGSSLKISGPATIADDGTGVLSVLDGATFAATNLTIGSLADSSGALVVSGSGSAVNLSGALNIGTALGTGDLTLGPGAAIHAGVINQFGQVVDEGGLLDPTVLLDEGTDGGVGTIASDFIIDEGTIAANSKKAANGIELVSGTVVGGGTLTISGGTTLDGTTENSPGLLLLDNIGTLEVQGPVLNAADTTFSDNGTPTGAVTIFGTYEVVNSVVDVQFLKTNEVLVLDDISGFNGTVTTTFAGDKIVITGGTLSNLSVGNGTTLTMDDSGNGGSDRIMFSAPVSAAKFNIVNGNTLQVVACFAAGTRIATPDGPVAVEDLRAGDRVVTVDGGCEPVVWLGQRTVNCARHPRPETVWPVRISAGAFGENVPVRDLYLSPDHAVFVNGVLVPVKLLIDGTSIVQVKRSRIRYFHVELPRHAVILAELLPVESYLDLGDRADFNGGGETIRLFADFAARLAPETALVWESRGAAPLVMAGAALDAAREFVGGQVDLSHPADGPRGAAGGLS